MQGDWEGGRILKGRCDVKANERRLLTLTRTLTWGTDTNKKHMVKRCRKRADERIVKGKTMKIGLQSHENLFMQC